MFGVGGSERGYSVWEGERAHENESVRVERDEWLTDRDQQATGGWRLGDRPSSSSSGEQVDTLHERDVDEVAGDWERVPQLLPGGRAPDIHLPAIKVGL